MSCSQFVTLEQAVNAFELTVQDVPHLFADVRAIGPSDRLRETLEESLDLASSISTEKARSELIITPILLEVRRILRAKLAIFRGRLSTWMPRWDLMGCVISCLVHRKIKR